jgi:hypothetical protein
MSASFWLCRVRERPEALILTPAALSAEVENYLPVSLQVGRMECRCGRRIMVITLASQAKDDGSIPFARSIGPPSAGGERGRGKKFGL